jgi:hypothetical protein
LKRTTLLPLKCSNGVDAEALFIRSLAYFYLVRLWKDVPLVLEPSISDTTNLYIPKSSSEKEVINQVINDLLKAKIWPTLPSITEPTIFMEGQTNMPSWLCWLMYIFGMSSTRNALTIAIQL